MWPSSQLSSPTLCPFFQPLLAAQDFPQNTHEIRLNHPSRAENNSTLYNMADDDENASSSDTHALLVGRDDHPSKKMEDVTVVSSVPENVDEPEKFTPESAKDVAPVAESSRGPSISTVADQHSDAGSVHSMPIVRVTDSPVPMIQEPSSPAPSPSPSALSHRLPPSPARSQTLQEPPTASQPQQRRAGRRSTAEVC